MYYERITIITMVDNIISKTDENNQKITLTTVMGILTL